MSYFLRRSAAGAMMLALALGAGAVGQARAAEEATKGPVVQIGQADEGTTTPRHDQDVISGVQQQAPKYWIGLGIGVIPPDHVLRAFVDIPEHQGLLVGTVADDSPAAKAGLKQHDVLLSANGIELHDPHDLTDLVSAEGAKKGQIALEVLRKSGRETVNVTPGDRPEGLAVQQPQFGNDAFGGGLGGFDQEALPRQLLEQFRNRGPVEFRQFGQGDGQGVGNIPEGVSVNVQKEGDKPAHITVKRGDETWEVTGGDEESLNKLPEELRPMVEQMLSGESRVERQIAPNLGDGHMRERMERIEKQMEQMLQQLQERHDAPKVEESK